jgi:hypothetical protein
MKGLWIATVSAIITFASIGYAAEAEVPAWKKATPGTHAFLGDDGGGVNTATVCDTADRWPLVSYCASTNGATPDAHPGASDTEGDRTTKQGEFWAQSAS